MNNNTIINYLFQGVYLLCNVIYLPKNGIIGALVSSSDINIFIETSNLLAKQWEV